MVTTALPVFKCDDCRPMVSATVTANPACPQSQPVRPRQLMGNQMGTFSPAGRRDDLRSSLSPISAPSILIFARLLLRRGEPLRAPPMVVSRYPVPEETPVDIRTASFPRRRARLFDAWRCRIGCRGMVEPAPLYGVWTSGPYFHILFANKSLAWNIFGTVMSPSLTNAQIEDRKIYNTRIHSQSNTRLEFTDVLTDKERTALIEYLKTL